MPFLATILNKQRRVRVDLSWLKLMSQRVLASTIKTLKDSSSVSITTDTFKALEARGTLGVTLVSDKQIKELNWKWRHKNAATDVLSFPMGLDFPSGEQPFDIGEIVISVERAMEQAKSYNHSLERELAFLFTHGTLHVLGFDHKNSQEETVMFSLQREILNKAGFTRDNS